MSVAVPSLFSPWYDRVLTILLRKWQHIFLFFPSHFKTVAICYPCRVFQAGEGIAVCCQLFSLVSDDLTSPYRGRKRYLNLLTALCMWHHSEHRVAHAYLQAQKALSVQVFLFCLCLLYKACYQAVLSSPAVNWMLLKENCKDLSPFFLCLSRFKANW